MLLVAVAAGVLAVVHAVAVNVLLDVRVAAEPAAHAAVQPVVSVGLVLRVVAELAVHVALVAHVAAALVAPAAVESAVHAAPARVAVVARSVHVVAAIVAHLFVSLVANFVVNRAAIAHVVVASDRRVVAADEFDPVNDLAATALALHCHAPDYSATSKVLMATAMNPYVHHPNACHRFDVDDQATGHPLHAQALPLHL